MTDCNEAIYDALNDFAGGHRHWKCCAGRASSRARGASTPPRCSPPGQTEEIDRVYAAHPDLNDDEFVASRLSAWLS